MYMYDRARACTWHVDSQSGLDSLLLWCSTCRMEDEWDPNVRRDQRRDLRHIIQDAHKHREEITLPDELVRRVKKINTVFEGVVSTREAALDAEGFQLLSTIGREQAESTTGELVFDPVIFAEKLVTFMGGRRGNTSGHSRDLNWSQLGEKAIPAFKTAPHLTFLHGALDVAPLVKKERQRAGKKKSGSDAAASKPKELSLFEEEESTTKDVAHIFQCLKLSCSERDKRIHYFRFLVDPESFAHTVENLFHFSFLVKDGRAGILINADDQQPYIHLPASSTKSVKQHKSQGIMSVSKAEWKRAVEKFNIKSAQIPPRED